MRFIIHQQPYERTIASGRLHYVQDDVPTGAVETYRMTAAAEGYRFFRVDLDARQASSKRSTLYHLTLGPDGRPVQLKYRFWGDGLTIVGVITWDGTQLTATREVDGLVYEDEAVAESFWFPSGAGLALLRPLAESPKPVTAVTLNQETADPSLAMAFHVSEVTVAANQSVDVAVAGKPYLAREYEVGWDNQQRRVWLTEDGWPLKVWRDDGLTGVARNFVIYQFASKDIHFRL